MRTAGCKVETKSASIGDNLPPCRELNFDAQKWEGTVEVSDGRLSISGTWPSCSGLHSLEFNRVR